MKAKNLWRVKNMKKLLAIVLVFTMVFALAACGGKENQSSKNNDTTASTDGNTTKPAENKDATTPAEGDKSKAIALVLQQADLVTKAIMMMAH